MTRSITRCIPCTGDAGLGIDSQLTIAAENSVTAVARCYAKQVNRFAGTADNYELVFPAGRRNRGRGKYAKTARWEKPVGVYWDGLRGMFDHLDERIDPRGVGICIPFPPSKRALVPLATNWFRISIDDMGGRYRRLMKRLPHWPGGDGEVVCSYTVETAATDNPGNPRHATRFVTFPGMENVVQRVRASIVQAWVERNDAGNPSPISGDGAYNSGGGAVILKWSYPPRGEMHNHGLRLSLYLPAKDCETMTPATLRRVLPLFVDCSIQGVIPDEHLAVVREWRAAGPVKNTEGVR